MARLEAVIDVVAEFLRDQPNRKLVDLEPGFVHDQMAQVLPMVTAALVEVLAKCANEDGFETTADRRDLAGVIARTALSHYVFPDDDPKAARREIRAAAGLGNG